MPALRSVPASAPKAIGYIRRSAKGEETISYEVQDTAIRDYCARRGYELIDIIIDPGISGLKWEKRKGIQETLRRVEAQEASKVVIWRWSRLSRKRLHQAVALDRFEKAGAEVESATEPFDTTTAGGEFGRDVMLAAAAFESKQKSEQWRDAGARRVRNGLPHDGGPRNGYTYSDGAYTIARDEAEHWKSAYESFIDGVGFPTIRAQLRRAGVVNARSRKPMVMTTVMRTMDSGFLAGLICSKDQDGQYVYSKGAHDPVIDQETWDLYRAARRHRVGTQLGNAPRYRISGLVRCGDCGAAMVAKSSGYNFVCGRWHRGEEAKYVSSVRTAIEEHILNWLETTASEITAAAAQSPHSAEGSEHVGRQLVARQINGLDAQLTTLTRQLAAGLVPESAYLSARDEILSEKAQLQADLDRLVLAQREPPVKLAADALNLVAHWDTLPVQECRQALMKLIRYVEVHASEAKWTRPTFRVVPAWEPAAP